MVVCREGGGGANAVYLIAERFFRVGVGVHFEAGF